MFGVGVTIDLARDNVRCDLIRAISCRQLVLQIWSIGLCKGANQCPKVLRLRRRERIRQWLSQHLPYTLPVALQVVAVAADAARAVTHKPAEDHAAAYVQKTPSPLVYRPELFA